VTDADRAGRGIVTNEIVEGRELSRCATDNES
jgi:hypothetical protein